MFFQLGPWQPSRCKDSQCTKLSHQYPFKATTNPQTFSASESSYRHRWYFRSSLAFVAREFALRIPTRRIFGVLCKLWTVAASRVHCGDTWYPTPTTLERRAGFDACNGSLKHEYSLNCRGYTSIETYWNDWLVDPLSIPHLPATFVYEMVVIILMDMNCCCHSYNYHPSTNINRSE